MPPKDKKRKLSNNPKQNEDLEFGADGEKSVHKLLEEFYDTILTETSRYATCDFMNDDFCIELKTRNNTYEKYPTTMIGQNKIEYMKIQIKRGVRCVLAFNFTDGLYVYELTPENILLIEQNAYGGRRDRGKNEIKFTGYSYIDIKLLEKVVIKINI